MYTAQSYHTHTHSHTHAHTPVEPVKDKPSKEMQQKTTPLLFWGVGAYRHQTELIHDSLGSPVSEYIYVPTCIKVLFA